MANSENRQSIERLKRDLAARRTKGPESVARLGAAIKARRAGPAKTGKEQET